jgi:hypothetical protein
MPGPETGGPGTRVDSRRKGIGCQKGVERRRGSGPETFIRIRFRPSGPSRSPIRPGGRSRPATDRRDRSGGVGSRRRRTDRPSVATDVGVVVGAIRLAPLWRSNSCAEASQKCMQSLMCVATVRAADRPDFAANHALHLTSVHTCHARDLTSMTSMGRPRSHGPVPAVDGCVVPSILVRFRRGATRLPQFRRRRPCSAVLPIPFSCGT